MVIKIDSDRFGRTRDDIKSALEINNIHPRKYFHPVCTDFLPYKDYPITSVHGVPYLEVAKKQVLCLPFHSAVEEQHLDIISETFQH